MIPSRGETNAEIEFARFRCVGDDGTPLIVIDMRRSNLVKGPSSVRSFPGARRLMLSTGEVVRYIDPETYEVVISGELIRLID